MIYHTRLQNNFEHSKIQTKRSRFLLAVYRKTRGEFIYLHHVVYARHELQTVKQEKHLEIEISGRQIVMRSYRMPLL